MSLPLRPYGAAASLLPILLSGCSLLPTTRKLPVPKAPALTQTVAPDELVAQLNKRWDGVDALTATVEIRATELKNKEGVEKDFSSCRGFIVIEPRIEARASTREAVRDATQGSGVRMVVVSSMRVAGELAPVLLKHSASDLEKSRSTDKPRLQMP